MCSLDRLISLVELKLSFLFRHRKLTDIVLARSLTVDGVSIVCPFQLRTWVKQTSSDAVIFWFWVN
jgi:hypothetical protein